MDIKNKIRDLTIKELLIKTNGKINKEIKDLIVSKIDSLRDSRNIDTDKYISESYISKEFLNQNIKDENLNEICKGYINHEFDLLGSGLTRVEYNSKSLGVENYKYENTLSIDVFDKDNDWLKYIIPNPYIKYSKYILSNVSKGYKFIDWQLDFKSGFRFSAKEWYKNQPIGMTLGVDIKVPWELSRMQHFPQMAICAMNSKEHKFELILEFKNQVLDFIATNPVRIGCNWNCTMDVGIRVSNWLIAYDIFSQIDTDNILDAEFKNIFNNSIYDHGKFIINNLEWDYGKRANHYLANIAGLLFVSSYLNSTEEIDSWLAFAIQELINEMEYEFNEDGSNFEASTSYHRLSGEIIIFCTALIYGVLASGKNKSLEIYKTRSIKRLKSLKEQKYKVNSHEFFPKWYIDRLFKIGKFTEDILKSNGEIPQVGDNDSGRFIKLTPSGYNYSLNELKKTYINLERYIGINKKDKYFDEEILNHESLVVLINSLFKLNKINSNKEKYIIENSIIDSLSSNKKLDVVSYEYKKDLIYKGVIPNVEYKKEYIINFESYKLYDFKVDNIERKFYPDFGIYIYKTPKLYLSIYAGVNGQNGNGGHAHNDKLSIDITINGNNILMDPGTYLYTSMPDKRNIFRSIKSHNIPLVNDDEQCDFKSLFSLKNEVKCYVLEYTNSSIKLYVKYKDVHIVRSVIIFNNKISIIDECNKEFSQQFNSNELYSNGYGKLLKNKNY